MHRLWWAVVVYGGLHATTNRNTACNIALFFYLGALCFLRACFLFQMNVPSTPPLCSAQACPPTPSQRYLSNSTATLLTGVCVIPC